MVNAVPGNVTMIKMAPETTLWRQAIPCIKAPLVSQRIITGWLGRIASLEVHQVPAEIAFPEPPVGKQDPIVETEVRAMIAVLVPVIIVLVQGVPAVLAQGVPTNVTAVMAAARGVSTDEMFVVNPDHLPIRPIHGLTGLNPPFPKVYVYGVVVEDIGAQSAGGIHGKFQQLVDIVDTCIIRLIYAVLRSPDMSPLLEPHPTHHLCPLGNSSTVLRPSLKRVKCPFPAPMAYGQKTAREGSLGLCSFIIHRYSCI